MVLGVGEQSREEWSGGARSGTDGPEVNGPRVDPRLCPEDVDRKQSEST